MQTASIAIAALALLLSVATFVVSRRDTRRSAASADRAVTAAEESAAAANRSADAVEAQLKPSTPPAVAFVVEQLSKTQYVLRNVGHSTAHGVSIEEFPGLAGAPPAAVTLDPGQGTSFLIMHAMGAVAPTEIVVRCDELPESKHIPMPCRDRPAPQNQA